MKKAILVLLMAAVLLALTGCSCKHEETTLTHAVAATCTQEGYTGDKVCVKCNETVEKGEAIPAAGHTEIPRDVKAGKTFRFRPVVEKIFLPRQ